MSNVIFFLYFSFPQYSKKYLLMEEKPFRKEGNASAHIVFHLVNVS